MVEEIVGGTPTMAIYLLQTLFFAVVGVPPMTCTKIVRQPLLLAIKVQNIKN